MFIQHFPAKASWEHFGGTGLIHAKACGNPEEIFLRFASFFLFKKEEIFFF
jgi:hypothetical protein